MLKRLKEGLFQNETQKLMDKVKIDKTHDFVHPKHIGQITNLCLHPRTKSQLLTFLSKALHSPNLCLKIKSLIVLHVCVRLGFDEEVCELAMDGDFSVNGNEVEKIQYKDKEIYAYLKQNCIDAYTLYIKKMCGHKDTYIFAREFVKNMMTAETKEKWSVPNIEIVNHGFRVLNLCRFLLQFSQMFNKMGRYYIEYEEIMSMYLQVLQDLDLFNSYINKTASAILIRNYPFHQPKQKKELSVRDIKLSKKSAKMNSASTSLREIKEQAEEAQKTRHFFLYINQCQNVADQLYEFFHNRYYFKQVKDLIMFPAFLSIKNKEYNRLAAQTRRVDKNLVDLVKASKYYPNTTVQGPILTTQPSILNYSLNVSLQQKSSLKTELNYSMVDRSSTKYENFCNYITTTKQQQIIQEQN